MERYERIDEAITASGLKRKDIAAAIGVTPATITQWATGETANLRLENLFALADLTGYAARWLALEEGAKYADRLGERLLGESPALYGRLTLNTIVRKAEKIERAGLLSAPVLTALSAVLDIPASATAAEGGGASVIDTDVPGLDADAESS